MPLAILEHDADKVRQGNSRLCRAALASIFAMLAACSPSLGPRPTDQSPGASMSIGKDAADKSIVDALNAWAQGDTDKGLRVLRSLASVGALRPLAEAGDPKAQVGLGRVVANAAVPNPRLDAANWYRLAADQGDPDGLDSLGLYYQNGEGGLPKDAAKARALYEKAVEKEWPPAMTSLGTLYLDGIGVQADDAKAKDLFERGAAKNDPAAMVELGIMYEKGKGVPADPAASMKWYRQAADLGYPDAIYGVGDKYERGDGVPQDYSEAKSWYERGVNLGHAGSIERLGTFYLEGHDVPVNYVSARAMFQRAAAMGQPQAMNDLSTLYQQGDGVPKEPVEAYVWLSLAVKYYRPDDALRPDAVKSQADLAADLSPADRAKAQQRINDWKPQGAAPAV